MKFFRKNLKFVLSIAVIIFLVAIYLNKFSNSSKFKTYNSKSMNISISIPNNSKIEDKFASITITDGEGSILIDRNGTNFMNIEDYMAGLDRTRKNPPRIEKNEAKSINRYNSILRIYQDFEDKYKLKIYYLYVNNSVYSLSTSSPELYDDLDQIANSFIYTGK